jgi:LPXTG-motif cell wall-anchored protein
MVLLLILFGLLMATAGLAFFVRRRKTIGALLLVVGGALVVLGSIALLSFHP